MSEAWGERSTVTRAVQRVIRSFVEWGVLQETADLGVFAPAPKISAANGDQIGPWLIEAGISNTERRAGTLSEIVSDPAFYPFILKVLPREVEERHRLELHRQGLDEDLVVLRRTFDEGDLESEVEHQLGFWDDDDNKRARRTRLDA